MSNLLHVLRLKPQKKSSIPLMVEVPVNPELAPFLVSSTTGVMWIEEAHPGDIIKAAVRKILSPAEVFAEIIQAVAKRGAEEQWGNVHPFTQEGVQAAIHHLEFYGLEDVELLVARTRGDEHKEGPHMRPEWLRTETFSVPLRPSSWVPEGWVVALPVERNFVGTLAHFSPHQIVLAVHNPSRGLALARVETPSEEEPAVGQLA